MAYGQRWSTSWDSIGAANTYTVIIKEDGYVGSSSNIDNLAVEPLAVRNRGNNEFSIGAIIGTEIEFSFAITPSDGTAYDDLLTAVSKQFLIEVQRDGSPYFVGYMKTENISKNLLGYNSFITLSATDGLADLKNFPYVTSSGDNYTDRVNFLTTIKRALTYTGHELDINVKLGTHHLTDTLMTALECALDKTDVDNLRFYRTENGILNAAKCSDVLTQSIGLFNCSIMQLNGEWYIFNNVETNSYIFPFDWATLTQGVRAVHNPVVAIDAYDFFSNGTLDYRPPLSKLAITFENKYVDTSLISNGDFSGGLTGWTNGSGSAAWDSFSVVSEELNCAIVGGFIGDREFISNSFSVNEINSSDIINISVRSIVDTSFTFPTSLKALITNTTTSESILIDLGFIGNKWQNHKGSTPIMGDGNYTVTIILIASEFMAINTAIRFDDVYFSVAYGDINTTDKIITISNDNAIDEYIEEYTTYIGDSQYSNDEGCILISGTLTSEWRTYGNTEDKELLELLGAFQLNAKQDFTKYLRVDIVDINDNINTGTIIQIDGANYRIIRFNKSYRRMNVNCDLLEVNV